MPNAIKVFFLSTYLLTAPCFGTEVLKLAILNLPPYEFISNNQPEGIAVDIVEKVFETMEQPITIELLPWSRALRYLKAGEIDGVFSILKKEERKAFADFSNIELIDDAVSLYVIEDSLITFDGDLRKLKHYNFGIRQDFSYGPKFDQAISNKLLPHVTRKVNPEQLLEMLYFERIDILIGDTYSIPYLHRQMRSKNTSEAALYKNIKRLTPSVQATPSYMAFSKKKKLTELRDRFDHILLKIKADGTYDNIVHGFLSSDLNKH